MNATREMLEVSLQDYQRQLGSLNSYLGALKERVEQHGTSPELFEEDLLEAEHNVEYYEAEVARLTKELGRTENAAEQAQGLLARVPKPDGNALILASITFAAGILVGFSINAWGIERLRRR